MEYLEKVLTYLKQELPNYQTDISLVKDRFVVTIPESKPFNDAYEDLHLKVSNSIQRIRNREKMLEFTIKSKFQERDFTL